MSNETIDPRPEVCDRITFATQLFNADVQAMSHDQLTQTAGGESRCGYDLLFELVGFFETFTNLLGSGPGVIQGPQGGWVRATSEFCDKPKAVEAFNASAITFKKALTEYSGNFVTDEFPSPVGTFTPLAIGNLAVWHIMFHSGQLNYIQTIQGDSDFHWVPKENA